MRWHAPTTWLALLGTAALTSHCAIEERSTVCEPSLGAAEIFADPACDVCASEACCAEATACAASPACVEAAQCMRGCAASGGDPACIAACKARPDLDPDLIGDIVDCAAGSGCECTAPELDAVPACEEAGSVPDALGPSCAACIRRNLCDEAVACADDAFCADRLACMAQNCQGPAVDPVTGLTPGCFDRCRGQFPPVDGGTLPEPQRVDSVFFLEVARACRNECRVGRELSCVGAHDWPRAEEDTIQLQRIVQNRVSGAGIPGLDVAACFPGPGECRPIVEGVTEADGLLSLEVPTTTSEFDPGAGFQGYLQMSVGMGTDPDLAWRDTLLIHTRPETRNRVPDEIDPYAEEGLLLPILDLIARRAGVEFDFVNKGVLVGGMVDCRARPEFFVPNASLVINVDAPDMVTRYVNESQIGIEGDATATTNSGQFIAINVPPGAPTVDMVDAFTGRTLASQPEVTIQPGKLTVIQFYPQAR